MGRALIIGGSLGGLFAGLLLRQAGWEVTVFERSAGDLASRGVGIGTHVEAVRRSCAGSALPSIKSIGVAVNARICLDRAGAVIARLPFDKVLSSWTLFYRALRRQAARCLLSAGHAARRCRAGRAAAVTALFADGTRDGRRSAGRRRRAEFHRAGARVSRRAGARLMPAMWPGAG